jgi:hypothetical protein
MGVGRRSGRAGMRACRWGHGTRPGMLTLPSPCRAAVTPLRDAAVKLYTLCWLYPSLHHFTSVIDQDPRGGREGSWPGNSRGSHGGTITERRQDLRETKRDSLVPTRDETRSPSKTTRDNEVPMGGAPAAGAPHRAGRGIAETNPLPGYLHPRNTALSDRPRAQTAS